MTMDFAESGPFWLSPQAEPTTETPGQRARRFERGALPYLGQADSPAGDWPTPGLGRRVPTMQAVPASLARRTPGLALTLGPATARRTADGCPPASTPSRCPVFDHHRSGALDRTGLAAPARGSRADHHGCGLRRVFSSAPGYPSRPSGGGRTCAELWGIERWLRINVEPYLNHLIAPHFVLAEAAGYHHGLLHSWSPR